MLTRYKGHGPSIFSIYKRSSSQSCFVKLAYHTNKRQQLKPLTEVTKKDNDDPLVDVGIPACTIMSIPQVHYKHHHDILLEDLPSLLNNATASTPTNNNNNNNLSIELLIKKIDLCCMLCDFSDPDVDLNAKRIKTANLLEIDAILFGADEKRLKSVPDEVTDALFRMINTNLFRGIPSTDPKYLIFDDEPPIVEVNWPHLQYVYSILLKFQKANPKDQRINNDYLKKVYTLLEAPDMAERNCVLDFLKKYVETYPEQINKIFQHFESIVRNYIDRVIPPFPIEPILSLYLVVLKDANHDPELAAHFFKAAVIPLISSQHIVSFYCYLTEIFDIFITKDSNYVIDIIKKLTKSWPKSAPSKQQLFISLINLVTEKVPPDEFEKIGQIVFALYAHVASTSFHAKIVQASLRIWSEVKIIPMIMDNTQMIFPIILPSVHNVMKNHWSGQARSTALDAMTSMHDYDPFMFDELSQQQQQQQAAKANAQVPRHRNWALIARVAARKDTSLNLAKILADIQMKFSEPVAAAAAAEAEAKKRKKRSGSAKQGPKIVTPSNNAAGSHRT